MEDDYLMYIFLKLSCTSCLYILEINCLSVCYFAIILSHSEGCLFTLLIVSFTVQKLLSVIRPHLFNFVFILIILEGGSKRILLWFMSKKLLKENLQHIIERNLEWDSVRVLLFSFSSFVFAMLEIKSSGGGRTPSCSLISTILNKWSAKRSYKEKS